MLHNNPTLHSQITSSLLTSLLLNTLNNTLLNILQQWLMSPKANIIITMDTNNQLK